MGDFTYFDFIHCTFCRLWKGSFNYFLTESFKCFSGKYQNNPWNIHFTDKLSVLLPFYYSILSLAVKLVVSEIRFERPSISDSDMFSKDKWMHGNAKFKTAPIIDVTKENVSSVGALVRGAIIGADFIAIDCVRVQADLPFLQKRHLSHLFNFTC